MALRIDSISVPDIRNYSEDDARRLVGNFLKDLTVAKQSPDAGRGMGLRTDLSLRRFFELVQHAIRSREIAEDVPEDKRLLVMEDNLEEDPPETFDTMAITFGLQSREPGQWGQGSPGGSRIRERTPHVRSIIEHPEHPGEKLITYGLRYSNYVRFNIYARTSSAALEKVFWLEDIMNGYRWYFSLFGFKPYEEGVGDKKIVNLGDLRIVKYPMTYFVASENTYHIGEQELRQIIITTDVDNTTND